MVVFCVLAARPLLTRARQADKERLPMHSGHKLFGEVALEKGFVTVANLYEALTVQARSEVRDEPYKFLGQILAELGYMTDKQVLEVLNEIHAVEEVR
jgi:rubrerythrin